jgi:hypothetical protein
VGPLSDGWTEADVEAVIARGDPAELLYVPLVVSHYPPGRIWAESICVRLAQHPDPNVRGNALEGFGHLARLFRALNQRVVQPLIEAGLNDSDEWVRAKAEGAAEDIEWFMGWVFRGREDRRLRPVSPRRRGEET